MNMVPDDDTEGFSFIWTIENFSYCLQKKGENLSSPRFKLNLSDANEWSLDIYPRGEVKADYIGVFLHVYSSGPFPIKVKRYLSIRTSNGTFKSRKIGDGSLTYEKESSRGIACFLNHSELFKKGDDAFLEKDTLTLRCRIFMFNSELPMPGQCYSRTVIDVKRIVFVWSLENFEELLRSGRKTKNFHPASSKNQSFSIDIFLSGEIYSKRKIQVEIKQNAKFRKSFLTCKLSLLDADGKTSQSVHDDHWFEASEETNNWHFPFVPVKKVLDNEELYLVNGALSLRCEFAVSTGVKYSELESTEYGVADEHDKACYSKTVDTGFLGSLKDNLERFYKEGKFKDLTIRTASNKEFSVHKAILCARSQVFSAMFEHDTKENRTSVVEIKDMNDDTLSKMLRFLYTDIVVDLDWQTASEMYFAADKYEIVALKKECSNFFRNKMNISNVCEVLVMADMHHDQVMKSAAQDFVIEHATEIINSEYWKTFILDKSNLAAETMHLLFIRNLNI